ncbi:hypothetical protein DJ76_10045 [Halorubrum ezzemoulense]|uniref:Uncharacterized protein n=1 Tax=Halorubrum ezzemoulense TaxID=337243 RepID=A0A256JX09_HALEZ|nr:hypothetical protein DJ76_10045 [Halorubrum ezzemoulense]
MLKPFFLGNQSWESIYDADEFGGIIDPDISIRVTVVCKLFDQGFFPGLELVFSIFAGLTDQFFENYEHICSPLIQ